MVQKLAVFVVALGLMLWAGLAPLQAATDRGVNDPASSFVQSLGDKALSSLTEKGLPYDARVKRVRELLRTYFDVPTIARFALGQQWKTATEAQKKEYMDLFEDMIVHTYAHRFEEYSGQSFKVQGANTVDTRDSLVNSQIIQKGGPPVSVQWKVRSKGASMKVVDVVVEDISMTITQRNDFAAVVESGGGSMDALLKSLRQKAAKR